MAFWFFVICVICVCIAVAAIAAMLCVLKWRWAWAIDPNNLGTVKGFAWAIWVCSILGFLGLLGVCWSTTSAHAISLQYLAAEKDAMMHQGRYVGYKALYQRKLAQMSDAKEIPALVSQLEAEAREAAKDMEAERKLSDSAMDRMVQALKKAEEAFGTEQFKEALARLPGAGAEKRSEIVLDGKLPAAATDVIPVGGVKPVKP